MGKAVPPKGTGEPVDRLGHPAPRPDRERERGRSPGSEIDESADRAGNSGFPRLSCRLLKKGTASIDPVFGLQFQINSDFKEKNYSILKTRDFPLASSDPGWTAGDFIFLTIDDPDEST